MEENTISKDGEPPMSLEDEFYFICNSINSILTQPPINYTSLRNVLYSSLGLNITLSTYQMAYIRNKITYFTKTLLMVKYRYDYIKQKVKKSEKFLKQNIDIVRITLGNILQNIEDLEESLEEFKEQSINQPVVYTPTHKENTEEGIWWVRCLFDTYLKYEGKRGVTSIEFFNLIKDNWEKLEDEETINISYITDNILGGFSLEHISTNLLLWLRANRDILDLKYRFIIKLMG
jgi:hypothetical protein